MATYLMWLAFGRPSLIPEIDISDIVTIDREKRIVRKDVTRRLVCLFLTASVSGSRKSVVPAVEMSEIKASSRLCSVIMHLRGCANATAYPQSAELCISNHNTTAC